MDYTSVKALAAREGRTVDSLLVMARQNDPFYIGGPTDERNADWFAEVWQRFGFGTGVHLRRIHYVLVSQSSYIGANGKPYENTDRCWQDLNTASRAARYLRKVPVGAFIDARNPPAQTFYDFDALPDEPFVSLPASAWTVPAIAPSLSYALDFPEPYAYGYGYEAAADQPYLLEVWCEKSTMNDVLLPLCQRYGANFQTGLGFLSITAVQGLIDRTRRAGKPCRVLYIADYDPAGSFMPRQIARQIEFWLHAEGLELDIALEPIALSREQVERYQLPRIPIKDTDKRAANFAAKYGDGGAVELDALEALHPGSLREIVKTAMGQFLDLELPGRLYDVGAEAQDWLDHEWQAITETERTRLAELRAEVDTLAERYRERMTALSEALALEVEPLRVELEGLWQAITDAAQALEAGLPARPEPDVTPEDTQWLFKSERSYLEQLGYYQAIGGGHEQKA